VRSRGDELVHRTSDAAMIGAAAFPKLARKECAGMDLKAKANLALA
jgi:hypothetical protein